MSRVFGSVLGAFVGDAAGAVLEFSKTKIDQSMVQNALEFNGGGQM